jgi:hypothetical protein
MITCYLRYQIDPYQLEAFERCAVLDRAGEPLRRNRSRLLPSVRRRERRRGRVVQLPEPRECERYRARFDHDPDLIAANRIRDETRCVARYEPSFMRPVLDAG